MSYKIWERSQNLISGQEYIGNQLVAKVASEKGFSAIIDEYVYIHPENVENTFNIIPNSSELIHGIGIDLGGGVGCISSTLAKRKNGTSAPYFLAILAISLFSVETITCLKIPDSNDALIV